MTGPAVGPVRLDDRVVVVTGGGRGMGLAYCRALAERGAAVVVNDLGGAVEGGGADPTIADQVAAEIRSAGGRAVGDASSVSDPEGARRMVQLAVDTFGHVDSVVSNAGVIRRDPFAIATTASRDAILDVNLGGTWNVVRAAWPHLVERGFGRIVCAGSHAGFYGSPDIPAYAASKAALLGFVRSLAAAGAAHDITVNIVSPGASSRMSGSFNASWARYIEEHRKPEFVVAPVVHLLSDGEITGRMFSTIGHRIAEIVVAETTGFSVEPHEWTPEAIRDNWERVVDRSELHFPVGVDAGAMLAARLSSTDLAAYGINPDVPHR